MAGFGLQVVVLAAALQGTAAFLATPLNTSDPDVAHILCPDQTVELTRDHKWITREAIRRNLRQFFLQYPPESQPDFNVPPSVTLTELYHAYYGASASPARFIKAVNSIAAANVKADSAVQLRHDPDIQGDGEELTELQASLTDRYPQILTSILLDEAYTAARSLLGLSFHSIQKFYAHSTWVEQGNTAILPDLGLPGFEFEDLADPTEAVCTPCPSSQGECSGNVVSGAGLSSGYYQYDDPMADIYLIPKPTTGGKCSHGGVLDSSSWQPAEGGINKDTASPCFSPHHHLHQQAAELAVQATDHYLRVLLDAVGNEKYRRLFDLYQGSALSIVIDTTGSMSDDIEAVKDQVASIVENTSPELYILAPYNDPTWGPGLRTDNATEFLEAVNALYAHNGGDIEEMFWSGLQLALSLTPDYGDIFCFTDVGAKDGEKMESDIARSQQQHNKVSIIYSGSIPSETPSRDYVLTQVEEYRRLADATGGLFIPSDKFSIDTIMPILSEGVESSDVDVTQLKGLVGRQDIAVPIDDSISDFEIRIAGVVTTALLKDITGTEYDLMDEASLLLDPEIEVVVYSSGLKAIKWIEPRYGLWSLQTYSSSTYSVSVSGNSTLSFLGGFSILDPSPPHPHYRAAEGNPLVNTVYYVEVTLIGYLESDVTDVTRIEYVDKSGASLREIPYHGEVDDEFYVRSDPLPEEPFYVKLYGHVKSGNEFSRLLTVLMTPVETDVGVLATSEDLAARPGDTASGDFVVSNYGLSSYFDITGTDDKGFLTYVVPERVYIDNNASEVVTVFFAVPLTAVPGTVSMVTLTAQSEQQLQSVNSGISQFVVLSMELDDTPPNCTLASQPDCSGFDLNGICANKNWTTQATLQDDPYGGLVNVYARPEGLSLEIAGMTPGTTGEVVLTYGASCCTTQVDLIGVDSSGNVGKCSIDMGTLGGMILDLEAVSTGQTWVTLKWTITPTKYEVHKYTILIDDDFTEDDRCSQSECLHNVTDLRPCTPYTFKVTPSFTVEGSYVAGEAAATQASTTDQEPSTPVNGAVVDSTTDGVNITWEVQHNSCISQFQVCYRTTDTWVWVLCERTSSTSYEMRGLEACVEYEVSVASITPSGLQSSSLLFTVNTQESAPGAPRNVQTVLSTPYSITVTWDDPLENAHCIDRYAVSYTVTDVTLTVEVAARLHHQRAGSDNSVIIENLDPCTNYTIWVSGITVSGIVGPYVESNTATAEIAPSSVTSVTLQEVTSVSMKVTWEGTMTCVDHFNLCYYSQEEVVLYCYEEQVMVATLTGLLPCVTYYVSVTAVSPSDLYSHTLWQTMSTLQVAPGEPQNLTVSSVTSHSISIDFDPPVENPQCTNEYDYTIIGVDEEVIYSDRQTYNQVDNIFEDLEACTNYKIQVRALSSEKLGSQWVTTSATTSEEEPSRPQAFQVLQTNETTLEVSWWAPDVNSNCVKYYELQWTSPYGDVNYDSITPAPGDELPFVIVRLISGLEPCTVYGLSVWAVTPSGSPGNAAMLSHSTLC
nr:von Willebrand factor A domain-containing protein 7-like isoform X1 [Procambarus clarkii]